MRYLKIAIAIALLGFVFFGSVPNSIDINPIPDEIDEVQDIINVDKPSEEVLTKVRPVGKLVTSTEDRARLALFNHEFAERITRYNTTVQQLNDVYVQAAKNFFGSQLNGKYENYSDGLKSLFQSVTTDDNHVMSTQEKDSIKEIFNGLAWVLIER